MTPPRVLYLSTARFTGGAERSLQELLEARCRRHGPDSLAVIAGCGSALADCADALGIQNTSIEFPLLAKSALQDPVSFFSMTRSAVKAGKAVSQFVDSVQPDILHANNLAVLPYLPVVTGRAASLPWILHARDNLPPDGAWRSLLERCRIVVTISRHIDRQYARAGVSPEKRRRIPNGLNLDPYSTLAPRSDATEQEARQPLGLLPDMPVVTFVGHWVEWKAVPEFLAVCERVRKECGTPFQILMTGGPVPGGDDQEERRIRSAMQALNGRVHLVHVPFVEDMLTVYAATTVLVSTARQEPFGRAVLEAMACGVAVVCRGKDGGGTVEFIQDPWNGLIADDEEQFIQSVSSLLLNVERRRFIGKYAFRGMCLTPGGTADFHFNSIDRVVKDLDRVYRSLDFNRQVD